MTDTTVYFAMLEGEELASACFKRVDDYQQHVTETGFFALWLKAYQMHYGLDRNGYSSFELKRKGKRGEYLAVAINHFRNLVTHYLTLATAQRMAMEPTAASDDWRAEMETRIARGVLDSYMRAGLEQDMLDAVEYAAVLGLGYVGVGWNPHAGDPVINAPPADEASLDDVGELVKTGNLESFAFLPQDVFLDPRVRSARQRRWMITRRWINKYELAAMFPDMAADIISKGRNSREGMIDFEGAWLQAHKAARETDLIALYEFWHDRTPACPNGRHALMLDEHTLLYADELVYPGIPIHRVTPANIIGTPFGFTPAWSLLAPQEAVNMLESIALTNQRAHGVGFILAPKGSDITPTRFKGLAVVEYPAGMKPELANFTGTPQEVFGNLSRLIEGMETVIGVNSVVRGNPEASLKSGSALALVQAQAVQFASMFQGNIVRFQEGIGQDVLLIFQLFAINPIRVDVIGDDGLQRQEEHSGESISTVRRVKVDAGNPLAKTLAGRVQLAENMVTLGLVKDPAQYIRVLETGSIEKLTETESRARSYIQAENEMLARARFKSDEATGQPIYETGPDGMPTVGRDGKPVMLLDSAKLPIVSITDDPMLHVLNHRTVLDSPHARRNPAVRKAVLKHIQDHHDEWWQATLTNPGMLELNGIPLMQSAQQWAQAQMPPPPGQEEAGAGGPDAPSQQQGQAPSKPKIAEGGGAPPAGPSRQPNMPRMPPGAAMTSGVNRAAPGPSAGPI